MRRRDGSVIGIIDVALVVTAPALKFGDALIQGRPGVVVKLLSQYGANTMEVTEAVEITPTIPEANPALVAPTRAIHLCA